MKSTSLIRYRNVEKCLGFPPKLLNIIITALEQVEYIEIIIIKLITQPLSDLPTVITRIASNSVTHPIAYCAMGCCFLSVKLTSSNISDYPPETSQFQSVDLVSFAKKSLNGKAMPITPYSVSCDGQCQFKHTKLLAFFLSIT